MAKISKMLKSKAMLPPDPDPMDEKEMAGQKEENDMMNRTAHREADKAMMQKKPPSIAAMIKVAKSSRRK